MKKDYFLKISMSLIGLYCLIVSIVGIGIDSGIIYKFFADCDSVLPRSLERTIIISSLIASLLMGVIFLMSPWVQSDNQSKRSRLQ